MVKDPKPTQPPAEKRHTPSKTPSFGLTYAPHLGLLHPDQGMFRHHAGDDPADQVAFMAEQGFTAMEDNWMKVRDVAVQERVGRALQRLNMRMGVIVNTLVYDRPTFVLDDRDERARLIQEVRETAEVAKRVGATHLTTLSGATHPSLPRDYQTANMIENLKWVGDVAAEEGLVLALEAINHKGWPGTFMTEVGHAHLIAKAVGLPSVKVLYDFWHQQIHGGDLIANLDLAWDEIAYVQIADNPGRVQPGEGEINYAPILRRLAERGFDGIVGLEFENAGPGTAGEQAVIDAIRAIDPR